MSYLKEKKCKDLGSKISMQGQKLTSDPPLSYMLYNRTDKSSLSMWQVTFHYVGYNESGRRIDSTYIQGSPARIRLGTNALVPGELY